MNSNPGETLSTKITNNHIMRVLKRNNSLEEVSFDKVLRRIQQFCSDLEGVDAFQIAQKVVMRIYDQVPTCKLDELAAEICSSLMTEHPDYGTLAARVIISNHHKNTSPSFSETIQELYDVKDKMGKRNPLVSDELFAIVQAHKEKLNSLIDYQRDYNFDFFGFKTLERSYLLKANGKTLERPQHMFMRVALGIHGWDIKDALETYDLMTLKKFTHATPTLFNAGTPRPQMASCYLQDMEDSIEGIFKTVTDSGLISKYAGGIGIHVTDVRARNSYISGTNGNSLGIIPMLRVLNNTARFVNQGSRRNGSIAIYLEPWHADVESFIELRKNHGSEEERCRDLFLALWVPDLFMKRVQANGDWTLMCPNECPGLSDAVGEEFEILYEKYEKEGRGRKTFKAQQLWFQIIKAQIETGTPYICYKDHANKKSNQKNLGTIKSSNLCVAPGTRILTVNGYEEIQTLVGENVLVWNGMEWSKTMVIKTGEDQEMWKVTFSNGSELVCTGYHKFYIDPQSINPVAVDYDSQTIETQSLKVGMVLMPWDLPECDTLISNVFVTSLEKLEEKMDTFCFNEPLRHAGIFNGVLTGNCSEVIEYSTKDEVAVCNLASIALPSYVKKRQVILDYHGVETTTEETYFDHEELFRITQVVTKSLNKVIDRTFYPIPETKYSNLKHRPIGLGVQGLADTYALLRMAFDSPEAAQLNKEIFETIYYGAVTASVNIAKKREEWINEMEDAATPADRKKDLSEMLHLTPEESLLTEHRGAYSTFKGSPTSEGKFQFDLWEQPGAEGKKEDGSYRWDWEGLRALMMKYGLRNSLLMAPMPTASTSQILGFTECFEPISSNIYQRRTLAGEFFVINKYLIRDLLRLGLWSVDLKNRILLNNGSIQSIDGIPNDIKALYKTVWELKMKVIIDQAADRGKYVCQSQSLNLFMEDPDITRISNMHFYGWSKGLKTGMYYLRTRAKAKTQAFTIDPSMIKDKAASDKVVAAAAAALIANANASSEDGGVCRREEDCLVCSA